MLSDKQFNRIEELVDENHINLHQSITSLISKFVDEIVSDIHDTSRALTKATNVDDTLFEDFKALDEDPVTKSLVELCIVDAISKDLGPRFLEVTKKVAEHS